jgi:hypothetical protein
VADRFWVLGSGNWSDTGHWSASSGGASGASVPTSADNAIFDAASNATAYTVTANSIVNCNDLRFTAAPSVSGTITFAGASTVSVYGNILLLAGMVCGYAGLINMASASGTKTITSNGVALCRTLTLSHAGTIQLADNLTFLSGFSSTLTRSSGTFDANGKSVTIYPGADSPRGVRGTITLFDLIVVSASKTDTINFTGSGVTIAGTFTYAGTGTNRLLVQSDVLGTARTVTAAAVSLTNVDFMDITGAGAAAPFTGTSLGDCLGNSGITFTPAATQYWKTAGGSTRTWSTAGNWFLGTNGTGGAGRVPLPQDDVVFDSSSVTSASLIVSADMPRLGKSITWTGVTNTPIWVPASNVQLFGSLTLGTIFTSNAYAMSFYGRSAVTFSPNGVTCTMGVYTTGPGLTLTLLGALTTTASVGINASTTFVDGGFSVTAATYIGYGALTKTGNWTLTSYGIVWGNNGGSVSDTAGVIKLTDTTSNSKTFQGGGKTYNTVWLSGAGTGTFDFTGSNTIAELKIDTLPKSIRFTGGTTTTIGTFTGFTGAAPSDITIGSITAASHTLAKSGGGTVTVTRGNISRSTASPGSTFTALDSIDGGNNVNWMFAASPSAAAGPVGKLPGRARNRGGITTGRRYVMPEEPRAKPKPTTLDQELLRQLAPTIYANALITEEDDTLVSEIDVQGGFKQLQRRRTIAMLQIH